MDEGRKDSTPFTEAEVTADGYVHWMTPVMFKSSCTIEVEKYPFDRQVCELKFVSWTRRINELNITNLNINIEVSNKIEL